MNILKTFALIFIILLISAKVFAQDSTGILKLFVYPDNMQVIVDDTVKSQTKSILKLKAGLHNVSIKSRGMGTIL